MTQQEFYLLPAVIEQINIQKTNRYGSEAHRNAFKKVGELAKQHGVWDQYKKSGGDIYD